MASDSGTSFPVAGAAVVALFLSTAFLGPRGFDLLRQSENDAGKQVQLSKPVVEARLWEDPFDAQRRHRDKLKKLCPDSAGGSGTNAFRRRRERQVARSALPPDGAAGRAGRHARHVQEDQISIRAPRHHHRRDAARRRLRRQRGSAASQPLCRARRPQRGRLRPRRQRAHGPAAGPRCASFSDCQSEEPRPRPGKDKPTARQWYRRRPAAGVHQGTIADTSAAAQRDRPSRPTSARTMEIVYETLRARVSGAAELMSQSGGAWSSCGSTTACSARDG